MSIKRYHSIKHFEGIWREEPDYSRRNFWWPFRKKKDSYKEKRPGAMRPEHVKNRIREVGLGKQIEILRIGFDGTIDDMPIIVEIIDITQDGFTGRIVNLERRMIEGATEKLVYAKKGGGIINFNYADGDIKDISISHDEELLEQERNVDALQQILSALETGDNIIVAYYDGKQKGTVNTEGVLLEKTNDSGIFSMKIEKINRIELENKITKQFDIQNDLVIDIEMV